MLKATVGLIGIDIYYFDPKWVDVTDVYIIPGDTDRRKIWRLRKMRPYFIEKYKAEFLVLPPDPKDKLHPLLKRIKIHKQESSFYLVCNAIERQEV